MLIIAFGVIVAGCGPLVDPPPAATPEAAAPSVTPDAPAARGISHVAVPKLSQDGFRRRAELITVRVRNLSWQADDLQRMVQLVRDNLDNLTHGELLIIATIVDLTSRSFRIIDRQQDRMSHVGSVAVRGQRQSAIRYDDVGALIENPPYYTPFPRHHAVTRLSRS